MPAASPVAAAAMPAASPVVASILRVGYELDARGFVLSVLRLLEDLFQPYGVPRTQGVAWPVRGLAPCAALPSSGLAQAGFNLSDGNVLESPGPVSGVATNLKSHETQRPDMMVPGQVRRHAHPVGIGHVSSFQQ